MNRSFFGQAFKLSALALLLVSVSFGQISLRRAVDYNNDNKADYVVYRPSNSVWYIQTAAGFTSAQWGNAQTDTPCPGDYDGDGKGDICVWRDTDGTFYVIRSSNGTVLIQQWGVTGDEPVSRVWNAGDARTDFAVARNSNGLKFWYILDSATGSVRSEQFGVSGDFIIPGDYDGDGRFDLAVQRPTSTAPNTPANIYIQRTTAGFTSLQYGFNTDFIAPGDYDGDGTTELTAVRETGNSLSWYILNVQTGAYTSAGFGTPATDFLAQNDYDGDGKTDIAVWRDVNGTFYVQGSQAGFSSFQFGAPADNPVASYDTH